MSNLLFQNTLEIIPGFGNRQGLVLRGIKPKPEEEWERMRSFVNFSKEDIDAMLATVEPLFRRGYELVVGNYDYLLKNQETAAILGWDQGADPQHLAERRRFFTVWLARTLGMDFSHEFANYLFRAGQKHAGHGERHTHIPEIYVTGAISLVINTFAHFLNEEMPKAAIIPVALAGWNKYLSMHLHMMLIGYHSAIALDQGEFPIKVNFYGRLRSILGTRDITAHVDSTSKIRILLEKILNYFPILHQEVFDIEWLEKERLDSTGTPWLEVEKSYILKPAGWRIHINGRAIEYIGSLDIVLNPGDQIDIFPPTR